MSRPLEACLAADRHEWYGSAWLQAALIYSYHTVMLRRGGSSRGASLQNQSIAPAAGPPGGRHLLFSVPGVSFPISVPTSIPSVPSIISGGQQGAAGILEPSQYLASIKKCNSNSLANVYPDMKAKDDAAEHSTDDAGVAVSQRPRWPSCRRP